MNEQGIKSLYDFYIDQTYRAIRDSTLTSPIWAYTNLIHENIERNNMAVSGEASHTRSLAELLGVSPYITEAEQHGRTLGIDNATDEPSCTTGPVIELSRTECAPMPISVKQKPFTGKYYLTRTEFIQIIDDSVPGGIEMYKKQLQKCLGKDFRPNTFNKKIQYFLSNPGEILNGSLRWDETDQGDGFWSDAHKTLLAKARELREKRTGY